MAYPLQALEDYLLCEERDFKDRVSLHCAKGSVLRCMGQPDEAAIEFSSALSVLDEIHPVAKKVDVSSCSLE